MRFLLGFCLLAVLLPAVALAGDVKADIDALQQQINSVAEKPMRLQQWAELWVEDSVLRCRQNASAYNIEPGRCPRYIRAKVAGCYHHVEKNLNVLITSREHGAQYISDFYECIFAWPHCNGREVRAPLNNSAQLCASAAGFQNKAVMAENGQPFSASPTTLWRPAARALRPAPYGKRQRTPALCRRFLL